MEAALKGWRSSADMVVDGGTALSRLKKRFSPETEFRVCRERMPSDENILRLELTKAMHALLIVGIPLVAIGVELALAIVVGRALKYGLGNFNRTE